MKRSRVYLRPPTARDREAFLAAAARSVKLHASWVKPPRDRKAFGNYLTRVRKQDHAGFLVRRINDDAIIGVINLNQIVRGPLCSAYLGYYAFSPFDGRGYVAEGLRLVLREAFKKMKLHRLEANAQPNNRASIALAKRCGFRREGISKRYLKIAGRWRDHERWAITIEIWRRKK